MTRRFRIGRRLRTTAAALLLATVATWTMGSVSLGASRGRPMCPRMLQTPRRSCGLIRPALDPGGVGTGLPGASLGVPAPLGGAAGALGQGVSGIASAATTGFALTAVETLVSGSAVSVLHETAGVLSETTTPRLSSTWFSAAYWKVAGLAAVLTLPFLFAASVQALVRSDLTLLLRAALGYLPLAMLAVALAAPLTMLLLSGSDELAAAVSSAAGHESMTFLDRLIAPLGTVGGISGSPFLVFLLGLFIVLGALMLWIELLMREAAVYVIVLMLPLAFAGFVWPARRVWALRSLEMLTALILSKFAIVAVLSLGGAALGHGVHTGLTGVLAGLVLLILGAFTPWALLRLLPLAEMASGTAGALRAHSGVTLRALQQADGWATEANRWAAMTANMRRTAGAASSLSTPPLRAPGGPTAPPRSESQANPASHDDARPEPPRPDTPDEAAKLAPGGWIYPGKETIGLPHEGPVRLSD